MVRSVPIQEHGDAIARGQHAGQACAAVSAARFADDLGACRPCYVDGPIARSVVDHDDSISRIEVATQGRDELSDGGLLIQARDDDPEGPGVDGLHTLIGSGRLLLVGDCGSQPPMNAFRIARPQEHDRSSGSRSMSVRIRRRTRSSFELITARTSVTLTGAIAGSASVPAS